MRIDASELKKSIITPLFTVHMIGNLTGNQNRLPDQGSRLLWSLIALKGKALYVSHLTINQPVSLLAS